MDNGCLKQPLLQFMKYLFHIYESKHLREIYWDMDVLTCPEKHITVLVNQYQGTHFRNNTRITASMHYEALHYTVFSKLLSLSSSQICILSFAPFQQRNSMHASLPVQCGKNTALKVLMLVTTKESYFPLNFGIKRLECRLCTDKCSASWFDG